MIIDADLAIKTLREVVKGKEDYVYEDEYADRAPGALCKYFTNAGQPACIVGHVLAKLGVTREDLTDEQNVDLVVGLPVRMTDNAIAILDTAQSRQDAGWPWGDALVEAEAEYRHVLGE